MASYWELGRRLKVIEAGIEQANCELLLLRQLVTESEPPEVVHALASSALRWVLRGDVEQARRTVSSLGIEKVSARRLRKLLEDKVALSYASLLSGRSVVGCQSASQPRSEWYNRMWLAW